MLYTSNVAMKSTIADAASIIQDSQGTHEAKIASLNIATITLNMKLLVGGEPVPSRRRGAALVAIAVFGFVLVPETARRWGGPGEVLSPGDIPSDVDLNQAVRDAIAWLEYKGGPRLRYKPEPVSSQLTITETYPMSQ